jgi:hypothetical protein
MTKPTQPQLTTNDILSSMVDVDGQLFALAFALVVSEMKMTQELSEKVAIDLATEVGAVYKALLAGDAFSLRASGVTVQVDRSIN